MNLYDETGLSNLQKDFDNFLPSDIFARLNHAIISYLKIHLLKNRHCDSPFNIFILPFYSLTTPANGKFSGVLGLKKLLGTAFVQIKKYRIREN